MPTKKKLLVIGGGAAGHQIAFDLQTRMNVTLVDPKTYWEVPMAVPRLLVEPDVLPARMSFKGILPNVRHIQGRAATIKDSSVDVETNSGVESIAFDYAVIATGSRYIDPLIKAESATEDLRMAEIMAAHKSIARARSIVVVGGGPVGVEISAELREAFPQVSIKLIHSGTKLLENAPSRFSAWATSELKKRKVDIVLNDPVVEPALGAQPVEGKLLTKSGRVFEVDVIIWAAGVKPNTDFVKASWPQLVEATGFLKTDAYLHLAGKSNIFVAGDLTNLPEGRLAIIAGFHVKSIVGNLKTLSSSAAVGVAQLKPYKPNPPGKGMGKMMIVTLGRKDGLTSLPFGQFRASFLARMIKSKDMLVGMSRKAVGLK